MSDFFNFDYTPDDSGYSDYTYDYSPSGIDYSTLLDNSGGGSDFSFDFNLDPSTLYSDPYSQFGVDSSGSSVSDWLGNQDWKGLLSSGLGVLGAYGNYRANKDRTKAMLMEAQARRDDVDLQRRKLLADQAASLASKASISNILASRGHLSPDNSNPWLNYVYQAQKEGGFTPQGTNPFQGYTTGQAVGTGMDLASLLAGLEAQNKAAPVPQMAGGGMVKSALKALRRMNIDGLETALVKPNQLPAEWVAQNAPQISDDYLNMIREANRRLTIPMDEEAERQFIQEYLSPPHGRANGGSTNAGPVRGLGGGQDDVVRAAMAPGEYVWDAESVSALGDGNNEEGARRLDEMRKNIRKHKRGGDINDIPPRAKSPLQYLGGK